MRVNSVPFTTYRWRVSDGGLGSHRAVLVAYRVGVLLRALDGLWEIRLVKDRSEVLKRLAPAVSPLLRRVPLHTQPGGSRP